MLGCIATSKVAVVVAGAALWLAAPLQATRHDQVAQQQALLGPLQPGLSLQPEAPQPAEHSFTLRQIYHHGTSRHPELHRRRSVAHRDVPDRVFLAADQDYPEYELPPQLRAKSRAQKMERLVDRRPSVVDALVAQSRRNGFAAALDASAWTLEAISAPDVTEKSTVLSLAYMAADAYVAEEGQGEWEDVGRPFNRSADFGWQSDGLRGHIWADANNSTVVIGLKGTTPAVFDGDGTTTNDKVNDNLFFSCCCAQQGQWTWHQVCDCATNTYSCNNTCVVRALQRENRYYTAARELYANVTELYPNSEIWLTGHSLGGAVSSFVGLTYGLPTVTFEAVPEALAASRLGLPVPPGYNAKAPQTREFTGAFHFGHTADPIYIGTCNGATASCSFAGYALETTCHTGKECVWDVVADKGWRVGIGTHKIRSVIQDVILAYDEVPKCKSTPECRDCGLWKMYEDHGSVTSTSKIPSSTTSWSRTRTSTCQTPGWFGCLDETTTGPTATPTTSSSTSSSSTSTCETPGWFWCKDKTTSTTTTTTTSTSTSTTSTTTTCETPGWFGCNDETTATTTTVTTTMTTTTSSDSSTPSTTCKTPGRFWGCWDTAAAPVAMSAAPGATTRLTPPRVTASTTSRGDQGQFLPDEM
ncbi:hypothetical protein CDD81_7149 [Ophiocordyceps australis]|uniref:triacylglycerol lipase n=1 Tax=Ophiocordyceps australis TaxID=1399860 RepID=A0A2C5Y4S4_9HYPO|nr:hypothetical protein CDD81_7149 [Ophiocordyceps australis]